MRKLKNVSNKNIIYEIEIILAIYDPKGTATPMVPPITTINSAIEFIK